MAKKVWPFLKPVANDQLRDYLSTHVYSPVMSQNGYILEGSLQQADNAIAKLEGVTALLKAAKDQVVMGCNFLNHKGELDAEFVFWLDELNFAHKLLGKAIGGTGLTSIFGIYLDFYFTFAKEINHEALSLQTEAYIHARQGCSKELLLLAARTIPDKTVISGPLRDLLWSKCSVDFTDTGYIWTVNNAGAKKYNLVGTLSSTPIEIYTAAEKLMESLQPLPWKITKQLTAEIGNEIGRSMGIQIPCETDTKELDIHVPQLGHVCKGTTRYYTFPVTPDGRQYRIILKTSAGNADLYSSRYHLPANPRPSDPTADPLSDISTWGQTCPDGTPWCIRSTQPGKLVDVVTFRGDIHSFGDPPYPDKIGIYGTDDSNYTIEVVEERQWKMSDIYAPDVMGPIDANGRHWSMPAFDDSSWYSVNLPYQSAGTGMENKDRFFRYTIDVTPADLYLSKHIGASLSFGSNDGVDIYINGEKLGDFGDRNTCVNSFSGTCNYNTGVEPIDVSEHLTVGRNVIAVRLRNGPPEAFFDLAMSTNLSRRVSQAMEGGHVPDSVIKGVINKAGNVFHSVKNGVRKGFSVFLQWPGSQLRITLYRPDGSIYQIIDGTNPPLEITIPDQDADVGDWSVKIDAIDIPHENYGYTLLVSSPLDFTKDSDADGMTDYWEDVFNFDKYMDDGYLDNDGDGLTNKQEFDLRINPVAQDTDLDGLNDSNEVNIGTDPANSDTDGDGYIDGQEVGGGSNPLDAKSHWTRLLQTGQGICRSFGGNLDVINCAGTGQDGEFRAGLAWPTPRFTDSGDGTVIDNLSVLMWTKDANLAGGAKTWLQALDYVKGMNAGIYQNFGYTDWRLPNINELESLIDAGQSYWALPNGHPFVNVRANNFYTLGPMYLSSTSVHYDSNFVWTVDMMQGDFGTGGTGLVWPVRSTLSGTFILPKTGQFYSYAKGDDGDLQSGIPWPNPRFSDNLDGTVTDNLSGMMWTKNANLAGPVGWPEAIDYIEGMNAGINPNSGYTDWRLPNRRELLSLIDYSQFLPANPIDNPFTNVQERYWSSTFCAYWGGPWVISIAGGAPYCYYQMYLFSRYMWPVRGGEISLKGSSIIGVVAENGIGVGGINITLQSDTTYAMTTTAANGAYRFSGLTDGIYTVTPNSLGGGGLILLPTSQTVTVNETDMNRVNFVIHRDSDWDRLLDVDEVSNYMSDPYNPDTDGDGIFDGYEVSNGLNPLTTNDQNFSDVDGEEWTDWQEFLAGSSANDSASMPQMITAAGYGWNTQSEADLWGWGITNNPGTVLQWVAGGGQDGSGYMHLEVPNGGGSGIRILETHPSWFLSERSTVYMRNNGAAPLHVALMMSDGVREIEKYIEGGSFDSNSNTWMDLLPADGQWHQVLLPSDWWMSTNMNNVWPSTWITRTRIEFWNEDGSPIFIDVDNLSNDCRLCQPLLGDTDNDGIANPNDNAIYAYNPDQRDTDGDGIGDVADAYPTDPARSQSDTASPSTDGSANVGSGGGFFTTTDGTLDVQVSAGAVATDTTVTVAKDTSGQGDLVVQTNSGQGELLAAYDFIPAGLTFVAPVTIVFHYSDLIDETNLGVYWYNSATGSYEQVVPYVQDTVANTLTVQVSHFSVYAVIRLLDTNPPTVGITMNPLPNAAGWHNTDVTVTFSCSDAESGIATCPAPSIVSAEGAGQVITGTATDMAGNSASTSVTVNLDKTPPALFCPVDVTVKATEPAGIPATDPSVRSFFIGAMANDNLDSVVSVSNNAPDFFLIGVTTVVFTAVDDAGNLSDCQAVVTVGNPPPVFDPIPGQVADEGQSLIFVLSAADPNHNNLTYEASGLPSGATFDGTSRTFSYTPGYDVSTLLADSFFDVFFTVTDGTTAVSQTVHITVRNVNRPPTASAGIDQQLECAGASCPIILDGSGSTDPDSSPGTQDDIAGYRWYEGYGTSAQQLLGTGKTISATLSLGNHTITLEVTDQSGAIGTDTLTITLDPARLSMFVFEKAEVDWPKNVGGMADVKLHGRMALPVGLLQQELIPTELISLDLAGQSGVFAQTVNFEVKGGEGEKWEYKANPTGAGIQNLSIHWKGAKFDYKGTVHLKTEFIGLTETALSLDREGVTELITISVNGVTTAIDGAGTVTASVPYEMDEDGEVTLTLPFELKPEMKITLTIGNQVPVIISVGDYYTPGGGKFELKAKIDPRSLTGVSRPATLRMNVALGREGFPGSAGVSEGEWKKLSTKEWKAELK